MKRSRAVVVQIDRPYKDVYAYLSDPHHLTEWGPVSGAEVEQIGPYDYRVELPRGLTVLRITPPNDYGILDYQVRPEHDPDSGPVTPMRLIENGTGCDVVVLWFQREGVSDEQFTSEIEWLSTDLEVLRSMLELK